MVKVCGRDVDLSIIAAELIIGVNIKKTGKKQLRVFVILFNSNFLLLIYRSVCVRGNDNHVKLKIGQLRGDKLLLIGLKLLITHPTMYRVIY